MGLRLRDMTSLVMMEGFKTHVVAKACQFATLPLDEFQGIFAQAMDEFGKITKGGTSRAHRNAEESAARARREWGKRHPPSTRCTTSPLEIVPALRRSTLYAIFLASITHLDCQHSETDDQELKSAIKNCCTFLHHPSLMEVAKT